MYLIQGLLDQQSKVKPSQVHTDTRGQALPVYALAHLFGFDLVPRVRNWRDLNFYRPTAQAHYRHIDALRRARPQRHRPGSHRAPLPRRHAGGALGAGRQDILGDPAAPVVTYSRRDNFYKAFREIGRVIRTVQLLRFLSDPQLRRRTTAETNKVESYNRFSDWGRFGNH